MSKTYETPESDEWIQPIKKNYRMECCDCGLVHEMDFRIYSGRVQFRARRNNRSTGQIRRHKRLSENSDHYISWLIQRIADDHQELLKRLSNN